MVNTYYCHKLLRRLVTVWSVYLVSTVAAVVFSQLTVSSSASWSLIRPPLSSVSGHESTMWPIDCCWPQSQSSDAARPHLRPQVSMTRALVCLEVVQQWTQLTWQVKTRLLDGRVTWLTPEADNQSSSHYGVMGATAASAQMWVIAQGSFWYHHVVATPDGSLQ